MKLIHNGKPNSFTLYAWLDTWDQHPERRPAMEAMVREGVITCDDGTPLRGITLSGVSVTACSGRTTTCPPCGADDRSPSSAAS